MVRGTSRSESRSKKTREPSTSPQAGTSLESERNSNTAASSASRLDKLGKDERREKNLTKDEKKNPSAHEKREIFKSYKKD